MVDDLSPLLYGAFIGFLYGGAGYLRRREDPTDVNVRKLIRKITLFTVAGAISVGLHDESSETAIAAQAEILGGTLGLAFDIVWERLRQEGVVPRR